MLLTEYDYATDIEVQREEAFEKGVSEGIQQGLQQGVLQGEHQKAIETAKSALSMKLQLEQIIKLTGLPVDEIKKLM